MKSLKDLEKHLRTTANDANIKLTWVSNWKDAESWVEERRASVPEIRDEADYLVGLHELGHILFPNSNGYEHQAGIYPFLARESLAWSWAARNALPVLGDSWTHVLRECLVGHFYSAVAKSDWIP